IEYPRDLDGQLVLSPVVEKQRFGAALGLIIARAHPDRIDVSPIVLPLGMNERIAVYLRGRGLQDGGLYALGQPEHVDGAVNRGFCRLDGIALVMDRRCRAGKVVDFIDLDIERKCHVMPDYFKARIRQQVFDIQSRSSKEIIDTDDMCAVGEKPFAKV